METTIYKFKIPSKEDYYSMSFEERHITAEIYFAYKNYYFIILKKDSNNHYICVVCADHQVDNFQKEGFLWVEYQYLVRIRDFCLEEAFVTDLNMNQIHKRTKSFYKRINKFPKNKKSKRVKNNVKKIHTSKKAKPRKIQKCNRGHEIKKDDKKLSKITKQGNIKTSIHKISKKITPVPMNAYEKSRYNSFCYWNCMHPVSAGRGNF